MRGDNIEGSLNSVTSTAFTSAIRYNCGMSLRKFCATALPVIFSTVFFFATFASAVDISSCTVIDSPGTYSLITHLIDSSASVCIEISSSNVTLEGNWRQIDGVGTAGTQGLRIHNSGGTLTDIVIRNVIIRDWHTGVYIQNVNNSSIESSTVSNNHSIGIQLSGSDQNTITGSSINTNNLFGVYLVGGSNNNTVSDCTVNNQGQGIQVGKDGSLASSNIFRGNTISGNKYGIDVDSSDFLTIEDNTMKYNWYAIYLHGTTDSTITGNVITDNGYEGQYAGIFLMYAQDNLIYNNRFDNYQNFEFSGLPIYGNTWNIIKQEGTNVVGGPYTGGNFWGDYNGFGSGPSYDCDDVDGDYICDQSYTLQAGNTDNLALKHFPDQDEDGVPDPTDNCPAVYNPDQANSDSDDIGDACDNCWFVDNDDQADTNTNCSAPPYTADPECGDVCEQSDSDGDGVPDEIDNCPTTANSGQDNSDSDALGDACDNCIYVDNPNQDNSDSDNLGNACDNCWYVANPDQTDGDSDCFDHTQPYLWDPFCGNSCDECPADPNKTLAGECGCGVPETDSDSDGTPDCNDNCPNDNQKIEPGICGCGVPDTDTDNDGYIYCNDNCPNTYNDQTDTDNDGLGDVCDSCPTVPNAGQQEDSDGDGVGDVCDNCPDTKNGNHIGTCANSATTCTTDAACGPNGLCITTQVDSDLDGSGDACDSDDDNDGLEDTADNCRLMPNGPSSGTCVALYGACSQTGIGRFCLKNDDCDPGSFCSKNMEDTDGDQIGDACNDSSDLDGDEWADGNDNCPEHCNPYQNDSNHNGIGDVCEFDLSVAKVEITQAVQDSSNSVPLIAGKNTWIRVYLDLGPANSATGPVNGLLRFEYENGLPMATYVNGVYQSVTLYANNAITAVPDPQPENIGDTLNFFIPKNWSWDSTPYMEITLLYSGNDVNPLNNIYGPVPLNRNFAPDLDIVFVPVYACANVYIPGWSSCPPPDDTDIWETVKYVERLFPVSRIGVWKGGDHHFPWDPTDSGLKGALLYNNLWWINLFTNDPVDDMRYYGLVCKELDPMDSFLSGSAQSGMGWGDQAWGVRQDYRTSMVLSGMEIGSLGGEKMAHEIGHTVLGNDEPWYDYEKWPGHVLDQCGAHGPYLDYPVTSPFLGLLDANGFDGNTVYDRGSYFDLMTYSPCNNTPDAGSCSITTNQGCVYDQDCPAGTCSTTGTSCRSDTDCSAGESCTGAEICTSGKWISATNYTRIFSKLTDETGLSSTQSISVLGEGDEEYLVVSGVIGTDGIVESLKMHQFSLPAGTDDDPHAGDYSLELQDAVGTMLFTRFFNLGGENPSAGSGHFGETLPYDQSTALILIRHEDAILETIPVSASAPEVTVTYPNGGEVLSGDVTITWSAEDPDGDSLEYDILFSGDGGSTWSAIAVGLVEESYVWQTDQSPGSDQALIRIMVSDGANTGQDDSDAPFTVEKKEPNLAILYPEANAHFFSEEMILFEGRGYDREDGPLNDSSFTWISDINGVIGTGGVLSRNDLSPGMHIITLTGEDSDANEATANVTIHISPSTDSDGDRIGDEADNCASVYNPDQSDVDSDGAGDPCDGDDSDGDGFADSVDNCRMVANDQMDRDGDGIGDACQCMGDFGYDGDGDGSDLAVFTSEFGRTDCTVASPCKGDFNRDGEVGENDLDLFIGGFGKSNCPQIGLSCSGELYYDMGSAAWSWAVTKDHAIALKFSPESYPWTVDQAKFWPWSGSGSFDIEVHVWDDDGPGGLPGSDLIPPFLYHCVNSDQWEVVNLPAGITINSGNFYIGWVQISSDPELFYNGYDDNPVYNGRSYVRYPDLTWQNLNDLNAPNNMMIRQSCRDLQ